jgi:3-oxoacyl-[acyl-carrier protein] reductase
VVLVTGGGRGIGEVTAKLFALHGARVVINYSQSEQQALSVVNEIRKHGKQAMAVQADIRDKEAVHKMFNAIAKTFAPVEILVNNATDSFLPMAFKYLTWDDVQRDIDVTLRGAFHCIQASIEEMKKNRWGKIINVSSIATDNPPPHQIKYVIGKTGLEGLTKALAVELAAFNIQVNCVAPSLVETDLTKHLSKLELEKIKLQSPMGRLAKAEEVAKAIVFLASDMASFTTGQKIMVTGGQPPLL